MMGLKTIFFFAALVLVASAQDVDIQAFDSFSSNTLVEIIITTDSFSASNPLVSSNTGLDSSVPGGERDVAVVAESGPENLVVHTGVTGGQWSVSMPGSVSGYGLMQYDGVDGVTQLDGPTVNGLNGFDITLGGAATSVHFIIRSDNPTSYTVFFYDSNNQISQAPAVQIPGTDDFNDYYVTFASATGSANLSSLGALEIEVEAFNDVDTTMQGFFLAGPESVPVPSIPPVPTPAPEPSPNGFTWYTFDDDDNGRSPCGDEPDRRSYFLSDDNIVYYYFFGFDFTTQEASSSDASTVVLSAAAAVAGVAAAVL